ncbi:hypothetical protein KSP39_PZI016821 [Platanthera zijinensis]|uniref:prolycopene isomerase n=1 Tax=Platanthera zijinensis TaxID=2320716 RepID=A0AAP0B7W8_9ASPA
MLSSSLHSSFLPLQLPKAKPHNSLYRGSSKVWIRSPCSRGTKLGFGNSAHAVLSADRAAERGAGKAVATEEYDAIVIGSGIGGLVAATQLAVKGARVLVLEKYVIPGGSSGFFQRDGFTFDVGSSVMFGFSDKGNLNLITQALEAVDCKLKVIPDPTTVHFHLPDNLSVRVHREYDMFISELVNHFPHEKEGIQKFYNECWKIFNSLNSLELKSLEEPMYLFGQFFQKPVECLTLAFYLPQNAGDIARKFIKDPQLLSFIDAECFIVSTVNAMQTPMINASMVLCDRHFGGVNYPVGGVGGIAKALANGLVKKGSKLLYKANVTNIVLNDGKAVGVSLSDGREFFAKTVISNATRWDTFGKLLKVDDIPQSEKNFQKIYVKAPSFLSIHMGVKATVLPPDTDCHHFILEDLSPKEYREKKELVADEIITRVEKKLFPSLKNSIVLKECEMEEVSYKEGFLRYDSLTGTYFFDRLILSTIPPGDIFVGILPIPLRRRSRQPRLGLLPAFLRLSPTPIAFWKSCRARPSASCKSKIPPGSGVALRYFVRLIVTTSPRFSRCLLVDPFSHLLSFSIASSKPYPRRRILIDDELLCFLDFSASSLCCLCSFHICRWRSCSIFLLLFSTLVGLHSFCC